MRVFCSSNPVIAALMISVLSFVGIPVSMIEFYFAGGHCTAGRRRPRRVLTLYRQLDISVSGLIFRARCCSVHRWEFRIAVRPDILVVEAITDLEWC